MSLAERASDENQCSTSAIIVLVHHCPSYGCLSLIPLHCYYYYCCLIRYCCYCRCFHLPSCFWFWVFSLRLAYQDFLLYSTSFGLVTSLEQLWKDHKKKSSLQQVLDLTHQNHTAGSLSFTTLNRRNVLLCCWLGTPAVKNRLLQMGVATMTNRLRVRVLQWSNSTFKCSSFIPYFSSRS